MFGGFFSVAVEQQGELFFDPKMFVLLIESHGRCETPQQFALKKSERVGSCEALQERQWGFINFDGSAGCFDFRNGKSNRYCIDLSRGFEDIEETAVTVKKNRADDSPAAALSQFTTID